MKRNRELIAALLAIMIVTPLYIWLMLNSGPRPGTGLLHWLGVIGMVLMLATETLYSMRKRLHGVRFGRLRDWLSVHIFMGIFGPYLVLLHAAWTYHGMAGIALLLTVLVVISGFIGRYIYTSIPRTANGVEMQAAQVEEEIANLNRRLQDWLATKPARLQELGQQMLSPAVPRMAAGSAGGAAAAYTPVRPDAAQQAEWRREIARLDRGERRQLADLDRLMRQSATLDRQLASLSGARRLLATWHTIHVPIGMVLFAAAALHVLAALYFYSLGR